MTSDQASASAACPTCGRKVNASCANAEWHTGVPSASAVLADDEPDVPPYRFGGVL